MASGGTDWLSAVTGLGGLAWNIGGGLLGYDSSQEAMQQQRDMFNEQMDFAKYQYEDQKKFNSAQQQVQRLRAAGLNPSLLFGKDAGMASSVAQPSAPQLHAPQLPQMSLNGIADISHGIINNMPEADKTRAEEEFTHVTAAGQAIENTLQSLLGYRLKDSQIQRNYNEGLKLYNEAMWLAERGETEKSTRQLHRSMEFLNYAAGGAKDAERQKLEIELKHYENLVLATIEEKRADAFQHYHIGRAYDRFGDEARSRQIGYDLNNGLFASTYENQIQGKIAEMANIGKSGQILDSEIRKANAVADQAEYAASQKEALFWKDYALDIAKGVADVAGTFYGWKNVASYARLSNAEKKRVDLQAQRLKFEQDVETGTYHQSDTYKYTDKFGRVHSVTNSGRRSRTNPY